jgi:ribosomal-protein-alanine N-acetyltransferase
MIPQLETRRLILTPVALSDAPAVQARFASWDIVRYLASTVPWPYPTDGALTYLRDLALPAMADGRQFHWAMRPKTLPHELIGMISLMLQPDDNRGFWLDPAWQGQGLMTEACDVVTTFWFEVLHQDVLRVPKAVANTRSRAISERSGMRVVWRGERDYVSGRHEAELWEITAAQWREQRQRALSAL